MNRQELEYQARKYGIPLIILLCVITFLLPLLLRTWIGSPITPGTNSYMYLREAELLDHGSIGTDPLSGARIAPNPYTIALMLLDVFGVPWALPLLLSVILMLILYIYLGRSIQSQMTIMIALSTLVVSPTMSVLSTTHTPELLALMLILLALMTMDKHPIMSSCIIGIAIITEPYLGALAGITIAGWLFMKKRSSEATGTLFAIAIGAAWYLLWMGTMPHGSIMWSVASLNMFFETGTSAGLSIFFIILAGYGLAVRSSQNMVRDIILTALLLIATAIIPAITPATVVILAVLVAYAVVDLMTGHWELPLLQQSLLILVGCIGIFLIITSVRERVQDNPDAAFAHTMVTLKNQYHDGAVLSAREYAPMIEQSTGRRATLSALDPDTIIDRAFLSRDSAKVYAYLEETGTSYILITPEMRRSIFHRSDEGILFLIDNSGRFVKVEETQGDALWYFIRTKTQ